MAEQVIWRQLYDEVRRQLPDVEARRIVEQASGYGGAEFFDSLDRPASKIGVASLDRMVAGRCEGRPLQYVLGSWGFRTLDLMLDERVLIPRPETETVVGVALEVLTSRGPQPRAIDLGTGSGAIALSLVAEHEGVEVVATDASAAALAVARANLAGLGRPATRVTLCEGSWFDPLPAELAGELDLIVSNPPYVADHEVLPDEVADWEPEQALRAGPTGLEAAAVIIESAPRWLRPEGALVLELAPHQMSDATALAAAAGLGTDVRVDLAGRDRVLLCSTR